MTAIFTNGEFSAKVYKLIGRVRGCENPYLYAFESINRSKKLVSRLNSNNISAEITRNDIERTPCYNTNQLTSFQKFRQKLYLDFFC